VLFSVVVLFLGFIVIYDEGGGGGGEEVTTNFFCKDENFIQPTVYFFVTMEPDLSN